MIILLNQKDNETAEKILEVQLPAYQIEADLIGFDGIPQLIESAEDIAASNETFIGYVTEGEIRGVLSYEAAGGFLEICRLVIHPNYFRLGIASNLVSYLLKHNTEKKMKVSTGSKNIPAKSLYRSFGFQEIEELEVASGIFITVFER